MRFYGFNRGALIESESRQRWEQWCLRTAKSPKLRKFAEDWVALMEPRAHQQRTQVKMMAASTMVAADSGKLTDAQIREVILILGQVWYLGSSLRLWAKRAHLIRQSD